MHSPMSGTALAKTYTQTIRLNLPAISVTSPDAHLAGKYNRCLQKMRVCYKLTHNTLKSPHRLLITVKLFCNTSQTSRFVQIPVLARTPRDSKGFHVAVIFTTQSHSSGSTWNQITCSIYGIPKCIGLAGGTVGVRVLE